MNRTMPKRMRLSILAFLAAILLALEAAPGSSGPEGAVFRSAWPAGVERVWAGPEYWANRLQDWRIKDGRLECLLAAPDRNVHVLTRRLGPANADLSLRVRAAVAAASRRFKRPQLDRLPRRGQGRIRRLPLRRPVRQGP